MDTELKQYLEGMEARIIDTVIDTVMERVGGRIDAVEDRLKDFIRNADHDLETKIIGEFWKWGRTSDLRTKQALDNVAVFNERMMAIEDRVSSLERRSA